MNIIDVVILVFLFIGGLVGFSRGFTRQLVSLIGIFAVIALSFLLKNPVSIFFYNNLPFINFGGIFKDITVINILFYEILAFIVVFIVLVIVFKILTTFTKIFERLLTLTIVLGFPSKILGFILGIVQSIIFIFVGLYLLNLPTFSVPQVKESKLGNIILDKTPILNKVCDKTLYVFNEVVKLKEEYEKTQNTQEYNQKVLNIMIDSNIITEENASKLIESGKIKGVTIE